MVISVTCKCWAIDVFPDALGPHNPIMINDGTRARNDASVTGDVAAIDHLWNDAASLSCKRHRERMNRK
jgi:hypothetical protein